MNDFILYYYLNPEKTHPYYVGCGRRNRLRTKTDRKKVPVPPPDRRVIVAEGLTQEESWELEKLHIKLWGRQLDGGVLINQPLEDQGNQEPLQLQVSQDTLTQRNTNRNSHRNSQVLGTQGLEQLTLRRPRNLSDRRP